jgi:transaldolase
MPLPLDGGDPMALRLFLDSADPAVWQQWLPSGLFHGVTTNPTLLRRAGQPCREAHLTSLTALAIELGAKEVHLQCWGGDTDALLRRGRALAAIDPGRVVVKVPVTRAGTRVARDLSGEGIPVTLTACFEPPQVLIAAALGVPYIAPYLGRISDLGRDGHAELIAMRRCLAGVNSTVRLLVASLRQPGDLVRLTAAGLDTFTLSSGIAAALLASDATDAAASRFEQDATAH